MADKKHRDEQTTPFEFRPGVGGFPPFGGMDRALDPAGIAPNKAHLLVNVRRDQGGWVSRGGQTKLFSDRLHRENVAEGGGTLWDEATGIGAITGTDPGIDETTTGGTVLYCAKPDDGTFQTGIVLSTWDGTTQRDYTAGSNTFGSDGKLLPIPLFDGANGALWGFRTREDLDGFTDLYFIYCRMANVNNIFGVTELFSTPKLSTWGGTSTYKYPTRLTWSPGDSAYYAITRNGLVLSFTENGKVTQEEDHSLDTSFGVNTVFGAPVIFEAYDSLVYLIGYGTGAAPEVMQPPLCYTKNLFTGAWSLNTDMTDKFVPMTRPLFHDGSMYVGGYTQTPNANSPKKGAVINWTGSGWDYMVGPLVDNTPVRGLAKVGEYVYYVYDDPAAVTNSIIGRFFSPTVGFTTNLKVFSSQFATTASPCDGICGYRGNLYGRFYRTGAPYNGDGLLWRSPGLNVAGTWVLAPAVAAPGQELNGAPAFVI